MSDILTRRHTHFVLWCPPRVAAAPELLIGRLKNGNPPTFQQLARRTLQPAMNGGTPTAGLFELEPSALGLEDDVYHYWFEVENKAPGGNGRIQVTDPA